MKQSRTELHLTSRWSRLEDIVRDWLPGTLFALLLVAVYAAVSFHEQAVEARAELEQRKAVVCPKSLDGKDFTFSGYERMYLTRPGYSKLTCFFKKAP